MKKTIVALLCVMTMSLLLTACDSDERNDRAPTAAPTASAANTDEPAEVTATDDVVAESVVDPALVKITPEEAEAVARETAGALCGAVESLRDWQESNLYCRVVELRPCVAPSTYPIETIDQPHNYDEGRVVWDAPVYYVGFIDGQEGIGTYLTIYVDTQTGEVVGGAISGE